MATAVGALGSNCNIIFVVSHSTQASLKAKFNREGGNVTRRNSSYLSSSSVLSKSNLFNEINKDAGFRVQRPGMVRAVVIQGLVRSRNTKLVFKGIKGPLSCTKNGSQKPSSTLLKEVVENNGVERQHRK